MKKLFLLGLLLLTVLSAATTITFDDGFLTPGYGPDPWFPGSPKGTVVDTQYSGDITFSTNASGVAYSSDSDHCAGTAALGWDQFLAVNTLPPVSGSPAILTVTFTGAAKHVVQFDLSNYDPNPNPRVIVRSYDDAATMLDEQTLVVYVDHFIFNAGNDAIRSMQFIDPGSNGFTMDNFQFNTAPEPSSALVLGLGILAWRKRRA